MSCRVRPRRASFLIALALLGLAPMAATRCSPGNRQQSSATPARLRFMRERVRAATAAAAKRPAGVRAPRQ